MTAIAKALALNVKVLREWNLQQIVLGDENWILKGSQGQTLTAKSVVMAIPAPQALAILHSSTIGASSFDWLPTLRSIAYDPCMVVVAGYGTGVLSGLEAQWQWLEFDNHPDLRQIILDSHKRADASQPVYILHSSADFARHYDRVTDLTEAGEKLLQSAGTAIHPALRLPQWYQVHRWRYAFPRSELATTHWLVENPLPLVFCGDGFGMEKLPVERAIASGRAAARHLANCSIF
jgi:predicted NAD/FAD-dependent oxidoreductase